MPRRRRWSTSRRPGRSPTPRSRSFRVGGGRARRGGGRALSGGGRAPGRRGRRPRSSWCALGRRGRALGRRGRRPRSWWSRPRSSWSRPSVVRRWSRPSVVVVAALGRRGRGPLGRRGRARRGGRRARRGRGHERAVLAVRDGQDGVARDGQVGRGRRQELGALCRVDDELVLATVVVVGEVVGDDGRVVERRRQGRGRVPVGVGEDEQPTLLARGRVDLLVGLERAARAAVGPVPGPGDARRGGGGGHQFTGAGRCRAGDTRATIEKTAPQSATPKPRVRTRRLRVVPLISCPSKLAPSPELDARSSKRRQDPPYRLTSPTAVAEPLRPRPPTLIRSVPHRMSEVSIACSSV